MKSKSNKQPQCPGCGHFHKGSTLIKGKNGQPDKITIECLYPPTMGSEAGNRILELGHTSKKLCDDYVETLKKNWKPFCLETPKTDILSEDDVKKEILSLIERMPDGDMKDITSLFSILIVDKRMREVFIPIANMMMPIPIEEMSKQTFKAIRKEVADTYLPKEE